MSATDAEFEYLNDIDDDDSWDSELEVNPVEPEDDFSDWQDSRQRARPERAARQVPSPGWPRGAARQAAREPELPYDDEPVPDRQATRRASETNARPRDPGRTVPRATRRPAAAGYSDETVPVRPRTVRRSADRDAVDDGDRVASRAARYTVDADDSYEAAPTVPRPARRANGRARAASAGHGRVGDERTQILITQGRRSAPGRMVRARNISVGVTLSVVLAVVLTMIVFRKGASWPPSVSVIETEIATACQNPNVASEPNQVNFACGKGTQQVLWVFSLLTSGDDPNFADSRSGRKGLEPITPAQGGEVAWSLDLHHPYDPFNSVDSLEVAARAINNIIGGASLTTSVGKAIVQPGLLSNPANCVKYTGSAAVISRAGYPDICAQPISSPAGQAALVADVYSQWLVGSPAVNAQEASILFQNASDPGNPQVQAILKNLPSATATG